MTNLPQIFNNPKFGEIRTVEINGKVYFVASDIAKALGYQNVSDAIIRHCRCVVKHDIPHPQSPDKLIEMNVIPEGDIYRLAAKSELPGADEFESWIFDEVLPTIQKTGAYQVQPKTQAELSLQIAQCLVAQERQIKALESNQELQGQTIQNIKDALAPTDKAWRKWVMDELKKIAYTQGGEYRETIEESYELLEKRGRCKLSIRVKNRQDRLREQGATKTAINKINRLDGIESDPRLKEIYSAIIKELSIKYLA